MVKEEAEWSAQLSEMQYFILRRGGTERPNSSPLVKEKRPGVFACAGCGAALFSSDAKFESGTGCAVVRGGSCPPSRSRA